MTLKEEAKALGIKGYHLMKDETLIERIAEAKQVDVQEQEEESVVEDVPIAKQEVSNQKYAEVIGRANMYRNGLGEKSRRYLEYVSAYRDVIPEEYKRAYHLIQIYL